MDHFALNIQCGHTVYYTVCVCDMGWIPNLTAVSLLHEEDAVNLLGWSWASNVETTPWLGKACLNSQKRPQPNVGRMLWICAFRDMYCGLDTGVTEWI